jgi:hypothetical protein
MSHGQRNAALLGSDLMTGKHWVDIARTFWSHRTQLVACQKRNQLVWVKDSEIAKNSFVLLRDRVQIVSKFTIGCDATTHASEVNHCNGPATNRCSIARKIRPMFATRGSLISQIPSLEINMSRHDIVDDITLYIRQSEISACVAIGEQFVVQA